jgi:CRISPR-associated protein (TIGR02584 family)
MTASVTTPKNLLLSVTGMSPAVVTETLYDIARHINKDGGKNAHWPDEIRIITTSDGKREIVERLVEGDWLRQVCEAVGQPVIAMADEHILVVPGANGEAVEDARNEAEHEALANFITATVRDFTRGDEWKIHASIAGGRKTMTFYLGYAMSLFGRHFDRMSHVLVSDRKFEVPGFYFPGQEPDKDRIETRNGVIKPSEADVILSDIPFIRMRHNLPSILIQKSSSEEELDYRTLVNLINLGDQHDRIHLRLTPKQSQVELFEGKPKSVDDKPVAKFFLQNPVYMAVYTAMARVTKESGKKRCRYVRTANNYDDDSALYLDVALELARVAGLLHGEQARNVKSAQEAKQAPQKALDLCKQELQPVQARITQAEKDIKALEKKLDRDRNKALTAAKSKKQKQKQKLEADIADSEQKLKAIMADKEQAQKDSLAPKEELDCRWAVLKKCIDDSKPKVKDLYAELTGKIINDNEMLANLKGSRAESIVGDELTDRVSEIRQKIEGSITEQLKKYLIPTNAFNDSGELGVQGRYYGLCLNPDQIEIVE